MKCIFNKVSMIWALTGLLTVMGSYAQEPTENIEDNIEYHSVMDAENIYVQLSTADQPTMLSMLRRGFFVYFDVKGKKKKKVSVQYPLETEAPQRGQGRNKLEGANIGEGEDRDRKELDITMMLEAMPKKAQYINLDYEEEFHLDLNKLGIVISYNYDEEANLLAYELKMPKQNIADAGMDFSKLAIGVVTPKMEQESGGKSSNISIGGGGRSGGRGQGGRSRGGQGGRGGGSRGGGQGGAAQQDQRPEIVSIDFWFKADLTD